MLTARRTITAFAAALVLMSAATAIAHSHIGYAQISLTIRYGAGQPTSYELDLDFYPAIQIQDCIRTPAGCAGGLSTPLFYLYTPDTARSNDLVHIEEVMHYQQFRALGLAFHVAYAATLGEPFEPYPIRRPDVLAASMYLDCGSLNLKVFSLDRMWMPDADQRPAAPLLRLTGTSRDDAQLSFFPGFTQPLAQIGQELLNATQRASR